MPGMKVASFNVNSIRARLGPRPSDHTPIVAEFDLT
jgi:exonuclease III